MRVGLDSAKQTYEGYRCYYRCSWPSSDAVCSSFVFAFFGHAPDVPGAGRLVMEAVDVPAIVLLTFVNVALLFYLVVLLPLPLRPAAAAAAAAVAGRGRLISARVYAPSHSIAAVTPRPWWIWMRQKDASSVSYMRPETAQGIFTNFKNVQQTARTKVSFKGGHQGKRLRNEIMLVCPPLSPFY